MKYKYDQRKYHLKNCERLFSNGLSREQIVELLTEYSSRNKNYWLQRGYSDDESITMSKSKMPGTLEYYTIFKKLSHEQATEEVVRFQNRRKNTLENFILKHGKSNGKQKFELYCKRQAYSNTLEYMINKYGKERGISKYYNANKNRAITLDNLIKKHGETMGHSIYDQYVAKQRKNGKTLEYFVEKYGEVEGTNIYDEIGKRKSMTYDGFLLRNDGDVEISTNQFEEYCKRRYNSTVSIRGVSKSSQDFFTKLHAEISKIGLDGIYYSSFNTEWGINIVGKRYVYLDFFVRSKGKVIEFYGDYYHANPKKFKSGDVIKSYGELKNVDRIWMDDFQRIKDIKSVPYIKDVMVIWSSDVESDEKEILQKCVKFLIE